jgi:hypothetical protein
MESAEAYRLGADIIRSVEADVTDCGRFDVLVVLSRLVTTFAERAEQLDLD